MKPIEVIYDAEMIASRVDALAAMIAARWPQGVMMVALLRGSFVFAADLVRALHRYHVPVQMDFMTLASYGEATTSSGTVTIQRDITESVEGRDVLLIDDILESGRTIAHATDILKSRGARSVVVAVLLEKPDKLKAVVKADMVGFVIPDRFVIGYGLDYQNFYRELPYIGVLCDM